MQNLTDLFEHTLRDIYYAEKKITKALPKMAKKATSQDLADAFRTHLKETEGQIGRLEAVFELVGKKPKAKKCEAMDGLVEEAEDLMKEAKDATVRDAAMLVLLPKPSSTTKSRATERSRRGPPSWVSLKPSNCSMQRFKRKSQWIRS